jgi:phage tail-like protein
MSGPVAAYNFSVQLINTSLPGTAILATLSPPPAGGFSECLGLESTMQVEEYREGGRNDGTLKFPGHISGANIKLKRGAGISTDLWNWHQLYLQGQGTRRDGIISLLDDEGNALTTWRFTRGLPVRWVGPSLIAGQSQLAVEELEIAHEGLAVQTLGVIGALAATVGSISQSFGGM